MIFTTATKAGQATTPGHFDLLRHEENLGERYSLYVCCTSGSVGMIISVDVITVPEILLHQERLFVPYVQVERTRVWLVQLSIKTWSVGWFVCWRYISSVLLRHISIRVTHMYMNLSYTTVLFIFSFKIIRDEILSFLSAVFLTKDLSHTNSSRSAKNAKEARDLGLNQIQSRRSHRLKFLCKLFDWNVFKYAGLPLAIQIQIPWTRAISLPPLSVSLCLALPPLPCLSLQVALTHLLTHSLSLIFNILNVCDLFLFNLYPSKASRVLPTDVQYFWMYDMYVICSLSCFSSQCPLPLQSLQSLIWFLHKNHTICKHLFDGVSREHLSSNGISPTHASQVPKVRVRATTACLARILARQVVSNYTLKVNINPLKFFRLLWLWDESFSWPEILAKARRLTTSTGAQFSSACSGCLAGTFSSSSGKSQLLALPSRDVFKCGR